MEAIKVKSGLYAWRGTCHWDGKHACWYYAERTAITDDWVDGRVTTKHVWYLYCSHLAAWLNDPCECYDTLRGAINGTYEPQKLGTQLAA